MVPPEVIVVVTAATRPVMIPTITGPVGAVVIPITPARKAVIDMSTATGPIRAVEIPIAPAWEAVIDMSAATGPMIIAAVGGSVMKAIIDMTAATVTPTAAMTPTAATPAPAPPRVGVINGYYQHCQCQRTHGETCRDQLQPIHHDDTPEAPPIASTRRACRCPS
jgi:hypothetical protein